MIPLPAKQISLDSPFKPKSVTYQYQWGSGCKEYCPHFLLETDSVILAAKAFPH
jgi:hypothetical protein